MRDRQEHVKAAVNLLIEGQIEEGMEVVVDDVSDEMSLHLTNLLGRLEVARSECLRELRIYQMSTSNHFVLGCVEVTVVTRLEIGKRMGSKPRRERFFPLNFQFLFSRDIEDSFFYVRSIYYTNVYIYLLCYSRTCSSVAVLQQ